MNIDENETESGDDGASRNSELSQISDTDQSTAASLQQSMPLILQQYFEVIGEVVDGKGSAKCLFCPGNKTFSGNLKYTTNLLKHLVSLFKVSTF